MNPCFFWDPAKAARNFRDHGIRFEEAVEVLLDPQAMMTQDRIEGGEYRWQTIGSTSGFLIFAGRASTWDESDGTEVYRIISARQADRSERRRYEGAFG